MHTIRFLQDLAVVMMVAGLVTVVFHRLKQPVVLGYILAGFIIGPHTPPFPLIQDEESIRTLADIGIIFLLFSLGLEFNLRKLTRVGVGALIAALLEIFLMVWLGYEIGVLFGWSAMDSLFLGAMLSISSTTIIVKALGELGKTREHFAQLVFGILIIEDILAILMIALLSTIAMTGSLHLSEIASTAGKLTVFLAGTIVVGLLAVPRLLDYVARFRSSEMLLISVLALCFGVSLLAVKLGYSVALGAFVIGAIIAEARHIAKIEQLTAPLRDMFSAVFFVAIGLLIDPDVLAGNFWPIATITIAVVAGKVFSCAFGTFAAGHDTRTALKVGMSLAQIGEFSFIIAALGLTLKVTSDFLYPVAVAVSALTTLMTPYLIKSSDALSAWFDRKAPRRMVEAMSSYTRWLGHIGERRHPSMAGKLARKWAMQMSLNFILAAGIFIVAAFAARHPPQWLPVIPGGKEGLKVALWLGAVILSLPLFIATFRKLQALGMLVAETRASKGTPRERAVVANGIPLAGITILSIWMMVLSATLLPPFNVLLVLLGVVAIVTILSWRFFIKIYSKAQVALKETLAQPPLEKKPKEPAALPSFLKEADLESVVIEPGTVGAGKLIRELQLRTNTGANIIAIERNGDNHVNPGPDEELQAGDHVLLLGTSAQLAAAKAFLGQAQLP